jgi:3-hydroxyisobutyrate dehydrogenase
VPASPANRGYAPGFAAALMLKDLSLAQEAAVASGVQTRLGAEAQAMFARFAEHHAGQDFSAIINAIRDAAA